MLSLTEKIGEIRADLSSARAQGIKRWGRWRKLRKKFIEAHPECAMCGWKKKLEAHHILPRYLYPEYALRWKNLITLCKYCHFRFGHRLDWHTLNPWVRKLADGTKEFLDKRDDEIKVEEKIVASEL